MTTIVNVILPDGETFITAEAEPVTVVTTTITEHVEHVELEIPYVFEAEYDEPFDDADTYNADPNARSQQKFDLMPQLLYGNKFVVTDPNNDNDTTKDSSAIKMYRTIYIEPPPNKVPGFMTPTLFTGGSLCVCGEGAVSFTPYNGTGNQVPNTVYLFGHAPQIGDRSHDNDGLLMIKGETGPTPDRMHKVHICPDPSDPNILIESEKHFTDNGVYLRIINKGPEVTEGFKIVFEIDSEGAIISDQMINNQIEFRSLEEDVLSNKAESRDILAELEDNQTHRYRNEDAINIIMSKLAEHLEIINNHLARLDDLTARIEALE